jgi:ADP-heptose:LPS heptosyltransferase
VLARLADVAGAVHAGAVARGPSGPHAGVAYARDVGLDASTATLAALGRVVPPSSARVTSLRARHPEPWLALHRGAGAAAKRWDAEGFTAVADWWRRRGGRIVDVQGPADAGLAPLDGALLAREWPLPELAALLAACDGWCGHDSGPSHLAAAVGMPGVVLFGPTDPARWRPLPGALAALVGTAGRLDAGALPPDDVVRALATALNLDIPGTGH